MGMSWGFIIQCMRKLCESLLKMACCLSCFAFIALSAAGEPWLTLKPVNTMQGGHSFECKNIA